MLSKHSPRSDQQGVFRLTTRRGEASLKIQVAGRLDGRTGHHLVDVVHQLTSQDDQVTIDLTLVAHMDSDGAEAVSRAANALASKSSATTFEVVGARFESLLEPYGISALSERNSSVSEEEARRRP